MTLPDERYRAVVNTREFLRRLCSAYFEDSIKKVPKEVREEARRLLKHFPDNYIMERAAFSVSDIFEKPKNR